MTEYEEKRTFVEEQLAPLLRQIDPEIGAVEYTHGECLETVYILHGGEEVLVNVTGNSFLYILIDVLDNLYSRSPLLQSIAQNDGSEEDKPDET